MNLINKKYTLLEKIGQGSFGYIYKGQNIRSKDYVAIKIEPIKNETKLLKHESVIYQYLNNSLGIPTVKWFGKDEHNYYMVIDLLGKSLQQVKNKFGIFSLKLVLQIGIQIIELLKTIHSKGLVHRDIKPENFLFGLKQNEKNIYIIDFGFCKSYLIDDKHMPHKNTHNLIGSNTYASVNAHNFIELSRRDDLESLGYMLIYFYLGTLSWQDISALPNKENVNDKIKFLKQSITEGSRLPKVLELYMNYVKKLSFEETPNYSNITHIFKSEIELMQKKI
jgi:casein kinase I family protein HRR25